MKKILIIAFALTALLFSCESGKDPGDDPGIIIQDSISTDIFLKIGENLAYEYNDLAFYDSSTHIIYFRTNHPEFDKIRQSEFEYLIEGNEIYSGELWPGYLSSSPSGIYISNSPYFYQNYALRLEYRGPSKPDLRNDPRIIQGFKTRNLLRSGLKGAFSSVELSGNLGRITFSITNFDNTNLLILDPDKTGHKLFHYFTNGLYLRNNSTGELIYSRLEYESPPVSNGWLEEWLSVVSPGATKVFSISYSFENALPAGDYTAVFEYPGLSRQVAVNELIQSDGRIWLGDLQINKAVSLP